MMGEVELAPVYSEEVTPEEYMRIYKHERDNVESVRPVSAALGSGSFGRLRVVYKRPVFRHRMSALAGR